MSNNTTVPTPANPAGWKFETRQIHAGQAPDAATGARALPIYQTTSYVFDSAEQAANRFALSELGPIYTRLNNPTHEVIENRNASLEGGVGALLLASGQAAITYAILNIAGAGDQVVASPSVYGGTYNLLKYTLADLGIETTFVENPDDLDAWRAAVRPNTKLFYGESVPNPRNDVLDIEPIAAIAHENGVPLIVDNTVPTPYLLRPIEHGADVVVHSATKYLGGHADLLGGVAATNDDALAERLWHLQMITGAMLSPTDSYRLLQEVKTLKLRLTQQQKNTIEVINYLEAHPAVKRVLYAGSHSEYEAQVHARQANGLGALISMELVDGADLPAFLEALKIFTHAVSLGGIESLVVRPALMVQAPYTQAHRDEYGGSDNLIPLAIGIEEIEDIIEDLERGLTAALAHQA